MQERAGDVDAPPLTAGELADRAAEQVFKVEHTGELGKTRTERRAMDAVQRRAALEVVFDGQVFIEDGILKDDTERAFDAVGVMVEIRPADFHLAAVLFEFAADNIDRGGFPGAVDAEEGEEFTLPHAEAQVVHGVQVAEVLLQMFDSNHVVHGSFLVSKDTLSCFGASPAQSPVNVNG